MREREEGSISTYCERERGMKTSWMENLGGVVRRKIVS